MSVAAVTQVRLLVVTTWTEGGVRHTLINPDTQQHFQLDGGDAGNPLTSLCKLILDAQKKEETAK